MIREESLRYYENLPAGKYECLIAIDPAGAKPEAGRNKDRDRSSVAILLSPLDFEKEELRDFYLWYWVCLKKSLPYVAELVANFYFEYRRYYATYILGEEHGIYTINAEIGRNLEQRGALTTNVIKRVTRGRHTGDLEQRLSKLLGLFETGRVWFKASHKNIIEEELLPFPHGSSDDGVSSLEIALTYAKNKRFSSFNQPINYARLNTRPQPGTGKLVRVG